MKLQWDRERGMEIARLGRIFVASMFEVTCMLSDVCDVFASLSSVVSENHIAQ
jgi:hypothetical protein